MIIDWCPKVRQRSYCLHHHQFKQLIHSVHVLLKYYVLFYTALQKDHLSISHSIKTFRIIITNEILEKLSSYFMAYLQCVKVASVFSSVCYNQSTLMHNASYYGHKHCYL